MPSTLSMLPASAGLRLTPASGPRPETLWDLGRPEVGPGVSRQSRHGQIVALPTHISQALCPLTWAPLLHGGYTPSQPSHSTS